MWPCAAWVSTLSSTLEGTQWIIHLGMTGSLQVTQPEAELLKHTHAIVRLASGKEVSFVEPAAFWAHVGHLGF